MSRKKQNSFRLKDLESGSGFQVPDGYFEEFPDRLQVRMQQAEVKEPGRSVFRTLVLPQLAVAASFAGLMIIAYTGITLIHNNRDRNPGLQQTEIAGISDFQMDDLDETMLIDIYNETGAVTETSEPPATDVMVEYLLLEDADIEQLMQEL